MYYLFRNTDNVFMLKDKKCVYKNAHKIDILNTNLQEYEILNKIFKNISLSETEIKNNKKFITSLLNKKYLIEMPETINAKSKIYKTFQYFNMIGEITNLLQFKKFQKKKVLIVGLGGTALEIIRQLVALDFENYILVDFDIVSSTNLNRQFLFTAEDVGKLKTDVVQKYITQNVPHSKVLKYNAKITDLNIIEKIIKENSDIDIVLCCADTPPIDIEIMLLTPLLKRDIAFLTSGVGIYKGSVGPLLCDYTHKKRYLQNLLKSKEILDTATNCSASYGITNAIISTLMADQCIKYLINGKSMVLNKILIYYFQNFDTELIDV